MAKGSNYLSDAFGELKNNVTWTPWAEVQKYTIIVAVFTVVFSLAIWGIDTLFGEVITNFFKLINS